MLVAVTGGIVAKASAKPIDNTARSSPGHSRARRGGAGRKDEKGKLDPDWSALRVESDNLSRQDKNHAKVGEWEAKLKDHRDLMEKTEREWSADLDRIRREPLSQVIAGLREKFHRCSELKPS
jgi:hypothetical protein